MSKKANQQRNLAAFTIVELLTVIAIIAIMVSLTVPATSNMVKSHRQAAAKNLIRSAMAQAQAYAVKERKYAGLRFQKDGAGQQYILLVENKTITIIDGSNYDAWNDYLLKDLYTPVDNIQPMTLPVGLAVMPTYRDPLEIDYNGDGLLDYVELAAATTFCVIFDPSGLLATKPAQCGPRIPDMATDYATYASQNDTIFENPANPPSEGLPLPGDEIKLDPANVKLSQTGVFLYEPKVLEGLPEAERWDYVFNPLEPMLINIYTGGFIEKNF